ncbi:MAG TPA: 2OG-Fe(II) oxygenase [Gammaproteobacteria bacterium]|nr:2OG-Fe(II) oxygenase [Gammaproteobacteria bacterium]
MAGLTPGDRIPDFARPDPAGKPLMFYDLHLGQAMALFICGPAATPETRAALSALNADDTDWGKVTRVALTLGTPAECAALVSELSLAFPLLVDDGTLSTHLLGAPAAGMTAFLLDDNLRITERLQASADFKTLTDRVAASYVARVHPAAQVLRQQAPVLFIPRVLDAALCAGLIAHFEETGGTPSGTAYVKGDTADWKPDPSVKMRRDIYLKEGVWLDRLKDALVRRALPEIQRCFNFRVTQHEVFKVIRYDAGAGYFRPHRDNESRDTQHRRFAMTLNLNTGAYAGGELHYPEFGPDLYEPELGGAAIFSCSLLHEVMPVTQGKRYAVLGFFFGEGQSIAPVEYREAGN